MDQFELVDTRNDDSTDHGSVLAAMRAAGGSEVAWRLACVGYADEHLQGYLDGERYPVWIVPLAD